MKYIKQLLIILLISFLGEVLGKILPFPIPASVYGMVIMFTCLISGIVKLEMVEDTAVFFLTIMPILFIPAGVGLITVWDKVRNNLAAIMVISLVSTAVVMVVTGLVAELVMKKKEKKENE